MKKLLGLTSILALAFGLIFAACGGDDGDSGGTCLTKCVAACKADCTEDNCNAQCDLACAIQCDNTVPEGCEDTCAGVECGTKDECDCGTCADGFTCSTDNTCVEGADCTATCEGVCGTVEGCECTCGDNEDCVEGECTCTPTCGDKECGDDGCGASCGTCPVGVECLDTGMCDPDCVQQCEGKQCGPDGCGEECGTCGADETCNFEGQCISTVCIPDCEEEGKECGSDGCGGICGTCPCPDCGADEVSCLDFVCTGDGVMTCDDIFGCLGECDPNDQACSQNCINSAPIEEQMKFNELYQCLVDVDYWACWDICPDGSEDPNCDVQALNDCFAEKGEPCEDAMAACFPPGTWTCKEAWICFITCPEGDEDCPQECLGEMNLEAQDQWNAFIDCLDENGYFDCFDLPEDQQDACLQVPWETCQPFLSACASGDKNCKTVWECMDTCAPMDDMCPYNCLYDGTPEAQDAYFGVLDCIIEQCGDQPDQECYNNALAGACGSLYNDCIAE